MHLEKTILTILFKNAKLNTRIKKRKEKKKKQPKFSQILDQSEFKGKQTSFFFFQALLYLFLFCGIDWVMYWILVQGQLAKQINMLR